MKRKTNVNVANTSYNVANTSYNVANTNYNVANTNYNVANTNYNVANTNYNVAIIDLHLPMPTPYTITDQEKQSQTEQLTHDENPTEYIYQASNNNYACQLETELTKAVKGTLSGT